VPLSVDTEEVRLDKRKGQASGSGVANEKSEDLAADVGGHDRNSSPAALIKLKITTKGSGIREMLAGVWG
jgi:hypothetical protein